MNLALGGSPRLQNEEMINEDTIWIHMIHMIPDKQKIRMIYDSSACFWNLQNYPFSIAVAPDISSWRAECTDRWSWSRQFDFDSSAETGAQGQCASHAPVDSSSCWWSRRFRRAARTMPWANTHLSLGNRADRHAFTTAFWSWLVDGGWGYINGLKNQKKML